MAANPTRATALLLWLKPEPAPATLNTVAAAAAADGRWMGMAGRAGAEGAAVTVAGAENTGAGMLTTAAAAAAAAETAAA